MAINMPADDKKLPDLAVAGELNRFSPIMKSKVAIKQATPIKLSVFNAVSTPVFFYLS